MSLQINDLRLVVLPSHIKGPNPPIELYNKIYSFWKSIWTETLEKMQLPPLDKDEFLRQDYMSAILQNDEVIACHLYSICDFRSQMTWESRYFSPIESELKAYAKKHNINSILTQEYLSIAPHVRKQKSQFSLPEVVMGIAPCMMRYYGCDSTGGTVRDGVPSVTRVSQELGCDQLETIINRYNLNHVFFLVPSMRAKFPGNPETQRVTQKLWSECTNYAPIDNEYFEKSAA